MVKYDIKMTQQFPDSNRKNVNKEWMSLELVCELFNKLYI